MPRPLAFTDEQTLLELQFFDVIVALQNLAVSQSAQDLIKKLKPNNQFKRIIFELNQTHERFKIFQERRTFPHLEFEELLNELKYLSIEDSVLTVDGFVRIVYASALVNDYLLFFDNNSQFQHLSYIFKDCYEIGRAHV